MKLPHHIPVIIVILTYLLFGLSLNVLPFVFKPSGQAYTWLEGHSDDFIGYVSYIKEGMYGRNTFVIRSLPKEGQQATSAHLIYIFIGKIGALLTVSTPIAYHLARIVLSAIYMILIYRIFLILFEKPGKSGIVLIFSILGTYISFYIWNGSGFQHYAWNFFDFSSNTVLRMMSRPHYEFGAVLFLIIGIILYLSEKRSSLTGISLFLLSIIIATVHPGFAFILLASIIIMIICDMFSHAMIRRNLPPALWSILGLCIGLVLSNWSIRQYPFSSMLAFEEYVFSQRLTLQGIVKDIVSFGPILWIGFPGIILSYVHAKAHKRWKLFMLVWAVVQFSLYFYFHTFLRAEKMRFIQSLYFIPLAYGTGHVLMSLERKFRFKLFFIGITMFIAFSLSAYIHDFWGYLHIYTDYKNFSTFLFPTNNMQDAYTFLNRHTPKESVVLADFEASNNILLYSHNFVIGNRQGWTINDGDVMERQREMFFQGTMSYADMLAFLSIYHIQYIYGGFQEKRSDIFFRYSALFHPVYQNNEVTIYQVAI